MVHPSDTFEYAATPPSGTRIMEKNNLDHLRQAVRAFAVAVSPLFRTCGTADVAPLLRGQRLLASDIDSKFTTRGNTHR